MKIAKCTASKPKNADSHLYLEVCGLLTSQAPRWDEDHLCIRIFQVRSSCNFLGLVSICYNVPFITRVAGADMLEATSFKIMNASPSRKGNVDKLGPHLFKWHYSESRLHLHRHLLHHVTEVDCWGVFYTGASVSVDDHAVVKPTQWFSASVTTGLIGPESTLIKYLDNFLTFSVNTRGQHSRPLPLLSSAEKKKSS